MTDFVQGQLRVRFRFGTLWPMLEIFRKLYLFTGSCRLLRRLFVYARGSTQNGKKKQLKIRAEFMTSVSYRPEVIISTSSNLLFTLLLQITIKTYLQTYLVTPLFKLATIYSRTLSRSCFKYYGL